MKQYKDKYYVFSNIMAESWCEVDENDNVIEGRNNELNLKSAVAVFDNRDDAFNKAWEVDADDDFGGTEYGVQFNRLCKDDSEVTIVD